MGENDDQRFWFMWGFLLLAVRVSTLLSSKNLRGFGKNKLPLSAPRE